MLTATPDLFMRMIPFLSMNQQASWIQAIATSQDRAAFAELFQFYAPRLRAYLSRGGLSDGSIEEVVQDVMLTVWRRAEQYRPERAAVSTWIFTIARNRRIDRLRRTMRPEPEPDIPGVAPASVPAPDDSAAASARAEKLRAAMATLPEEQAGILRRMYFDGSSQRTIARELDLPVGTVKSRVRLAMKHLRTVLDEETP